MTRAERNRVPADAPGSGCEWRLECEDLAAIGGCAVARVYFVKDRLALRGTIHHELMEDIIGEDDDFRASEYVASLEYHVDIGRELVPYVEGDLGWGRTKAAHDLEQGVIYGAGVRLKYFVADNAAIDLGFRYQMSPKEIFINDWETEDSDLRFGIGLRVLF